MESSKKELARNEKTLLSCVLRSTTHTKKGHQNERSTLAESSDTSRAKTRGQQIALDIVQTAQHFFPDLYARLSAVTDPRLMHEYSITEILLGSLFLFICKQDSRNAMNLDRSDSNFADNYFTLFGKRLPHMDTIDAVLREVSPDELERLKAGLISSLIEKKVFKEMKLLDQFYRVAVDATGVMAVNEGHCLHCLHKTSKNGVVSYFHNVLEAKLITPNGFAISLASEWIENPDDYDKQDCEQKAFRRLAEKLKKLFPRLRICIHADGLYPNAPFFEICKLNDWRYIVTLQDGNLKLLWEDIEADLPLCSKNFQRVWQPQQKKEQTYRWLSNLLYQGHTLSWVECVEHHKNEVSRFVYVSDLDASFANVIELATSGRLRFRIENEGFNTQKNLGYNLSHKFSRVSQRAMKNYICVMQIAHLINQLYELSARARCLLVGPSTIKNLWKQFVASLTQTIIDASAVIAARAQRIQIRYG